MVVGQIGQLGIAQWNVMVESKIKLEVVIILHHLVVEKIVIAKQ